MALSLDLQNRVLYSCSCSQLSPLGNLYFCRHCKVPRCQDCVFSTIESFSCPHCFEAVSIASEVKSKKGRCNHCFQCPQCSSTLTTRSIIVPSEVLSPDQSPVIIKREGPASTSPQIPPRSGSIASSLKSPGGTKLYFLSCSHCKWSTRDVGIKDKRSPIDFKDRPSPHQARIAELVAFYKEYALGDHAEREKAKKPPHGRRQRSYGSLLDPSKFTSRTSVSGGSEKSPPTPRRGSTQITWDSSLPEKMAAKAISEPQPPPDTLYSQEIDLSEIPSLDQRLIDPVFQPTSSADLWPHQLFLVGKKLHRCTGCDHILIKAEMNPGSIRFKIQQIAWHTFPQVRIVENPNLEIGKESELLMSFVNPVNYAVTISFQECPPEVLKTIKETITPVSLPSGQFMLTPNDDVGDLIDGDQKDEIEDDPKFVHSRHPGKLILKFRLTPENILESIKLMFQMEFSYKSTVEADKNNMEDTVKVPLLVRLLKQKLIN